MDKPSAPNKASASIPTQSSTTRVPSLSRQPLKGILKNKDISTSSTTSTGSQSGSIKNETPKKKSQRWDESNILETSSHTFGRDPDRLKRSNLNISEPLDPGLFVEFMETAPTDDDTWDNNCLVDEPENFATPSSRTYHHLSGERREYLLKRKLPYDEAVNSKLPRQVISTDLQEENIHEDVEESSINNCGVNLGK
ncbi:protein phosphatase inhibitor 2 family member C [Sorex araneus]|uniref:protein phosphatase inhibitor 2 family member C n=1 Tax=Sorex araneus TaxID=42254 RepID=UPI002433B37A|nr:protein phosphatase inhibitor 2 family member C [Sorex araneus]